MSEIKIKELFLGNSNAFIIASGNEVALIDGGLGNHSERIIAEASRLVEYFSGIKYVFITHAHYDHVGSIGELKKKCETTVVAQEKEANNLEMGLSPVPAGTMWLSKQVSWLGCVIFKHCIKFKGFKPDVVFSESARFSLGGHEIECIHTPGHTDGSMSVKIGSNLFSGDIFFHLLPGAIFPPFADDVAELYRSWEKIAASGASRIFPGHGKPFPLRLLKRCLLKRS